MWPLHRSLSYILIFLGFRLELEEVKENVNDPLGLLHGPFILGLVCSVVHLQLIKRSRLIAYKRETAGVMESPLIRIVI